MATGFFLLDNPQVVQQYTYPRRGGTKLSGTCIIHTSEWKTDLVDADASAEDCAWYMTRRTTYGAYHTMVDSDSILEMVPYEYEAWQDSETNNWAVGLSASLEAARWLDVPIDRRLRIYRNLAWAAADFVIYMRDAYKITVPLKRITGAQARARVPGFCAHGDSGIGRTDPGRNFDWDLFFVYTAEEIAKRDGGIVVRPAEGGVTVTVDWLDMATEKQVESMMRKVVSEEIGKLLRYDNTSGSDKQLYGHWLTASLNSEKILDILSDPQKIGGNILRYKGTNQKDDVYQKINDTLVNSMSAVEMLKTKAAQPGTGA